MGPSRPLQVKTGAIETGGDAMNMTMQVCAANGTVRQLHGFVRSVFTKLVDVHQPGDPHCPGDQTVVVATFRSYARDS